MNTLNVGDIVKFDNNIYDNGFHYLHNKLALVTSIHIYSVGIEWIDKIDYSDCASTPIVSCHYTYFHLFMSSDKNISAIVDVLKI